MLRVLSRIQVGVMICGIAVFSGTAQESGSGYQVARTFFIGGPGGWDYTTVDPAHRRLYVSHGMQVEAIDLESGKTVGTISGTLGARGIAVAPELGRGFIACAKSNVVIIFDLTTLAKIATVKTDEKPDAIVYDTTSGLVLAFTHSKSATVIQAKDGAVKGSIGLAGSPEFAVTDGKGKVYVSLQDTNEVTQLDPQKLHLDQRWPVKSCQAATSLGIDRKSRRLFVGCHNLIVAVMDADTGQTLQTLPIGPGVDGTVFDDETQLVFVSSGADGTATILHEDDPNRFTAIDVVKTRHSARTIALDPATHRVYLPFAKASAAQTGKGGEEQFEEGTFAVLELSR
jgi:DNA-binding beta-propeller fold protein YncE